MELIITPERQALIENNLGRHLGNTQQVKEWFRELPQLIDQYARRWGLTDLQATGFGTESYSLYCMYQQEAALLKLTPNCLATHNEITALRLWEPLDQVINLLEYESPCALLEPRLAGYEITTPYVLAEVLSLSLPPLHRGPQAGLQFPMLSDNYAEIMYQQSQQLPAIPELFSHPQTEALCESAHELIRSRTEVSLLHGDLGTSNIFTSDGRPCLTDPSPVRAEAVHDYAKAIVFRIHLAPLEELCAVVAKAAHLDERRLIAWARIEAYRRLLGMSHYSPRVFSDSERGRLYEAATSIS